MNHRVLGDEQQGKSVPMDGLEQDQERSLLCAAVSVSGASVLGITTQGPRAGEGTKRVCEAGAWPLQDPQEMTLLDSAHPDLHTSSTGVPSDEVLTSSPGGAMAFKFR